MNKRCCIRVLLPVLFLAVLIPSGAAEGNFTLSEKAIEAGNALELAESGMNEMTAKGLPATRYNDTLSLAKQIYTAQTAMESTGEKADYSFVEEKTKELKEMKVRAFRTLDELNALKLAIEQVGDINKSIVLEMYSQAEAEFESERYEDALKTIDGTYKKISEMEAIEAKLKAFYEAASRGILSFLQEWWKELFTAIAIIAAIVVLTYNKAMCRLLEKKIKGLETRKQSIKKLIAETQKDYFEGGRIPESTYRVRTKKYAELIRDINRQIPLLQEELAIRRKRRI